MTATETPVPQTALESATYDAKQAAEVLQCSVRHVRRLIDDGTLPGVIRLGRLVRISKRELERFIAGGQK